MAIKCAEGVGCEMLKEVDDKVDKKISRKAFYGGIGSILFIVVLAFITVNTMWAETRDAPERRQKINTLEKEMIVVKEQMKSFDEWKKEDKKLKEQLVTLLDEINKGKKSKKDRRDKDE